MSRPLHQRLLRGATWALAGAICLGSLLDAVSNAISLITPTRALILSVLVLLLWLALEHRIQREPLDWAGADGAVVRIKGLGWSIRIGLIGALMLLWVPVVIPVPRNSVPPVALVLYEDLRKQSDPPASKSRLGEIIAGPDSELKRALQAVLDQLNPELALRVGMRVGTDLFVIERDEHPLQCKLRLFRFRTEAGLKPLSFPIEKKACDARYEKVSRYLEEAVPTAIWGGNQLVLTLQILLWHQTEYIDLVRDVGATFPRGQFAFADLDDDGNKELIITQAPHMLGSYPAEFHFYRLDLDNLAYVEVDPNSALYKSYMSKFDEIQDKAVSEWLSPPNN